MTTPAPKPGLRTRMLPAPERRPQLPAGTAVPVREASSRDGEQPGGAPGVGVPAAPPPAVPLVPAVPSVGVGTGAGAHAGPSFTADHLVVDDPTGWICAEELLDGDGLRTLLEMPEQLWSATGHAAAVLAWKTYTYRLAQPLAAAWTFAREIPLLSADNVLVKVLPQKPYIRIGLRRSTSAVLATSPASRSHDAIILPDETSLLRFLRSTLADGHLRPLLERTAAERRAGTRMLWGQAAAGIAYAMAEISNTPTDETQAINDALGFEGLAGVRGDVVWRATCCLAFTTPTLSACKDCCTLSKRPKSAARAAAAVTRGP